MPKPKKRSALEIGHVYEKKYKGRLYQMTVVKLGDKIGFKVANMIHSTPTAAARAVIGKDHDVNGPRFWKMD